MILIIEEVAIDGRIRLTSRAIHCKKWIWSASSMANGSCQVSTVSEEEMIHRQTLSNPYSWVCELCHEEIGAKTISASRV